MWVCVPLCVCVYMYPWSQKRVPDSLKLEVQAVVSWEPNLGHLEEQQALLTNESSL